MWPQQQDWPVVPFFCWGKGRAKMQVSKIYTWYIFSCLVLILFLLCGKDVFFFLQTPSVTNGVYATCRILVKKQRSGLFTVPAGTVAAGLLVEGKSCLDADLCFFFLLLTRPAEKRHSSTGCPRVSRRRSDEADQRQLVSTAGVAPSPVL